MSNWSKGRKDYRSYRTFAPSHGKKDNMFKISTIGASFSIEETIVPFHSNAPQKKALIRCIHMARLPSVKGWPMRVYVRRVIISKECAISFQKLLAKIQLKNKWLGVSMGSLAECSSVVREPSVGVVSCSLSPVSIAQWLSS